MEPMYAVLLVLFVLSICGNAFQVHLARAQKRKPKYDLTSQDLLHDLTRRGAAIVKIEVIDATNLLLRSPRG